MTRLLLLLVALNTVASQLFLKRGVTQLGGLRSLEDVPRFIPLALFSPWILTSVVLQVAGYLIWMMVVTRERLGIAVAFSGASFYILMTLATRYFYGEILTPLQSLGILIIILGVICVALPMRAG